jgi:hypothetical protein
VTAIFEQLVAAGITLLPAAELNNHFVFERAGFIALVERRGGGFGQVGAPGLLGEKGMALLVWRGEQAFFVAKGWERAAAKEEVDALRLFRADLERILTFGGS